MRPRRLWYPFPASPSTPGWEMRADSCFGPAPRFRALSMLVDFSLAGRGKPGGLHRVPKRTVFHTFVSVTLDVEPSEISACLPVGLVRRLRIVQQLHDPLCWKTYWDRGADPSLALQVEHAAVQFDEVPRQPAGLAAVCNDSVPNIVA